MANGPSSADVVLNTQVHTKVFYFDIKSNYRGRYLKLSEKGMARADRTRHPAGCCSKVSLLVFWLKTRQHESLALLDD